MPQKRVLTIQDISCIGRCSMTVAHPILCCCGHETGILPTAVLSTHTGGFGIPAVIHLEDRLEAMWKHWQRQGIRFDAVYSGYLGSGDAADAVMDIARELLTADGELIVDPAMADHGKLYSGLDDRCIEGMLRLCTHADILIPNITEAAILAGIPWRQEADPDYVETLLHSLPCKKVALTGVSYQKSKTGVEIKDEAQRSSCFHKRVPGNFHGTGDIFSACFTGARLAGKTISAAAEIASDFTLSAIENTPQDSLRPFGVRFEGVLPELARMIQSE